MPSNERVGAAMDYFLLPDKIKAQLPLKPGAPSPLVVSAAGGLDGGPGECQLVYDGDAVRLFSRALGEDAYSRFDAPLSAVGFSLKLSKGKFDLRLDVSASGVSHFVKFSSFESSRLETLDRACQAALSAPRAPEPASQEPQAAASPRPPEEPVHGIECSPFVAMLAALMWASRHDGEISQAEDDYICRVAKGRKEDLADALALSKACKPMELAPALAQLDSESRLCIVANLYAACMADGVLRSTEQAFVREFADAMGVSEPERTTVRDVLLLLNRTELLRKART